MLHFSHRSSGGDSTSRTFGINKGDEHGEGIRAYGLGVHGRRRWTFVAQWKSRIDNRHTSIAL
jgi:hypothetical protein